MAKSDRSNPPQGQQKSILRKSEPGKNAQPPRKRGGQESAQVDPLPLPNGNGADPPPNGKFLVKRLTKLTRNPFLNFIRHLRMERDFRDMKELFKAAGVAWKNLSEDEKQDYREEATTIDAPVLPPPFFKLGEQKLGPSLRRNLAKFKSLLDKAVEKNLDNVCEQEMGKSGNGR
ncbi:unnamed protein product [Hermetia illucens]|uniref:HMG box domain-containing protein n=1 Tax=Hermetia illucens TaxID=343691 RepID=A0A7R8YTM7_HERIL|nr:unnamed protein product [Hermetia illucens]